jgi:hypothetical protein
MVLTLGDRAWGVFIAGGLILGSLIPQYNIMPLAASVALAVTAFMAPQPMVGNATVAMPQAQTVKEYVEIYFADAPLMIDIARCESRFRQFDKNGDILKNPTSSAIGIFQIMSSLHKASGAKMDMDINSVEGNLEYARYLYETEGTKPWASSKGCWGETLVAKK